MGSRGCLASCMVSAACALLGPRCFSRTRPDISRRDSARALADRQLPRVEQDVRGEAKPEHPVPFTPNEVPWLKEILTAYPVPDTATWSTGLDPTSRSAMSKPTLMTCWYGIDNGRSPS